MLSELDFGTEEVFQAALAQWPLGFTMDGEWHAYRGKVTLRGKNYNVSFWAKGRYPDEFKFRNTFLTGSQGDGYLQPSTR